jgi:hypothetical protein
MFGPKNTKLALLSKRYDGEYHLPYDAYLNTVGSKKKKLNRANSLSQYFFQLFACSI